MISAYESRLIKRASAEENEKKVAIRDQQIIVIKNILQEELSEDDNDRVMQRIATEAAEDVIAKQI